MVVGEHCALEPRVVVAELETWVPVAAALGGMGNLALVALPAPTDSSVLKIS